MNKQRSYSGVYSLTGAGCVLLLLFLDQITKYLAQVHLKGKTPVELIPEALELRYLYPENRGIAFGMFQHKVPVFILMSIVFLAIIFYVWAKLPKTGYYLPFLAVLVLMTSGALGNFVDRVFRGYVIDFIYISLIDFPIFNLADVFVVCSGILMVLLVMFRYQDEDFAFLNPRANGKNGNE